MMVSHIFHYEIAQTRGCLEIKPVTYYEETG